jgi:hypothetical protein
VQPISLDAAGQAEASRLCPDPAFAVALEAAAATYRTRADAAAANPPADHRATLADLVGRLHNFAAGVRQLRTHPLLDDMKAAAREALGQSLPRAWFSELEEQLDRLQMLIHVTDQRLGAAPSGRPDKAPMLRWLAAHVGEILDRHGLALTRTADGAWADALRVVLAAAGESTAHPERHFPPAVPESHHTDG